MQPKLRKHPPQTRSFLRKLFTVCNQNRILKTTARKLPTSSSCWKFPTEAHHELPLLPCSVIQVCIHFSRTERDQILFIQTCFKTLRATSIHNLFIQTYFITPRNNSSFQFSKELIVSWRQYRCSAREKHTVPVDRQR